MLPFLPQNFRKNIAKKRGKIKIILELINYFYILFKFIFLFNLLYIMDKYFKNSYIFNLFLFYLIFFHFFLL